MRKWVKPSAYEECFASNENIANSVNPCIEGVIECVYPGGKSHQPGDNGIYDGFSGDDSDVYKMENNGWHGACGTPTKINYSTGEGIGYEIFQGKLDKNRPITKIDLTDYTEGYHFVTWNSTDGTGIYHHKGRIKITKVDASKPNHS